MSTGSQVNLWGTYLNVLFQTTERASKGYQSLAVTASATISWSNYSASNDGSVAFLKLTGALSSAVTLTFPSLQHYVSVWNATGAAVTIKCSGGTGVTIPNGVRTLLYCDGVDYFSAGTMWLNTYQTTLTNAGDVVVKTTLEQAIANASLPATAGTLLVDASDTTAGYLGSKLTVTGSGAAIVTPSVTNPGGNEVKNFAIAVGALGLTDQGTQSASFAASAGNSYNVPTGGTITLPAPTGSRGKMAFSIYGTGISTLSGTVSAGGSIFSSFPVSGDQTLILTDSDVTRGWV
jgi:hypothetical protein